MAVAGVFLCGFLVSLVDMPAKMHGLATLGPAQYRAAIAKPYDLMAGVMMLVTILVSLFYCAEALHGERQDRSILFWKSMPVSDSIVVLAKACIPLLVVPLLCFAAAVATQWIMLLLTSVVLLANGLSVAALWTQLSFFKMSLLLLYHLLTAHGLWPFPVYCYVLLVSGWARRAVFLWAALPLVAIVAVERIAFNSGHFAHMLGSRIIGAAHITASTAPSLFPTNPMIHIAPGQFLTSAGLWIGLAVAAMLLIAAIQLRRYQRPN